VKEPDVTPTFYSQHGEDYLAWRALGRPTHGYYVEVGALDGRRFSNTYALEQMGWSGVCIEAHPDYAQMTRGNRPGAIVVHAACCDQDCQSISFYTNRRGSLSALTPMDPALIQQRYSAYFHGYQEVKVPARTLSTILAEAAAPASIDLLSIDVEGHELPVLRGLDFDRYLPRIVAVEALGQADEALCDAFMADRGYRFARQLSANRFYTRESELALRLARQAIDVPLLRTAHPLDPADRDTVIEPQSRSFLTGLKRLLAG
jgi:FkbM family methyltransferase